MFLANENFPAPSIVLLREAGFEVRSILETLPSITDEAVIREAIEGNLIILTFDKDYGEIIFRQGLPAPPAIIFFRAKGASPQWSGTRLLELLSAGRRFSNCFSIIEEGMVRQRVY